MIPSIFSNRFFRSFLFSFSWENWIIKFCTHDFLAAMSGWNHDATRRDRKHIYVCLMVKPPNDAEQCENSHPAGKCVWQKALTFALRSAVMLLSVALLSRIFSLSLSHPHSFYCVHSFSLSEFFNPFFSHALILALIFRRSLLYSQMLSIQSVTGWTTFHVPFHSSVFARTKTCLKYTGEENSESYYGPCGVNVLLFLSIFHSLSFSFWMFFFLHLCYFEHNEWMNEWTNECCTTQFSISNQFSIPMWAKRFN